MCEDAFCFVSAEGISIVIAYRQLAICFLDKVCRALACEFY